MRVFQVGKENTMCRRNERLNCFAKPLGKTKLAKKRGQETRCTRFLPAFTVNHGFSKLCVLLASDLDQKDRKDC